MPLLAALEPFTFKVNKMCLFAVHYLGTLCSADIQRQCFSLISNQHQPLASQQYFSLIANQHQPLVIISEQKVISALAPVIQSLMLISALAPVIWSLMI